MRTDVERSFVNVSSGSAEALKPLDFPDQNWQDCGVECQVPARYLTDGYILQVGGGCKRTPALKITIDAGKFELRSCVGTRST